MASFSSRVISASNKFARWSAVRDVSIQGEAAQSPFADKIIAKQDRIKTVAPAHALDAPTILLFMTHVSQTKYFDTKRTKPYGDLSQLDTPLPNWNSLEIKARASGRAKGSTD